MEKVVWGMIGCGDVTEVKNGPGLYLSQNSILKGITNRTLSKAQDWVDRHGHGMVYADVDELLADTEIDIVYIATTPDAHLDYAVKCAQAGKHCLIEKPLALDFEQGKKIEDAFQKAGKKAYVAFYRRSLNRFKKVKELAESGEIGKIMAVNAARYVKPVEDVSAWRMQPHVSGGNIFSETDIHALDFVDFLCGEAVSYDSSVNTFHKGNSLADSISLTIKFANDRIFSGLWLYNCPCEKDRFEIVGDKGMIYFDFFHNNEPVIMENENGKTEYVLEDSEHVGMQMEQEIVNELLGTGGFSGTVSNALRMLELTDCVLKNNQK